MSDPLRTMKTFLGRTLVCGFLAMRLPCLILSCFLMVAAAYCSKSPPLKKQALSAKIENARLQTDQSSIAFDFVITNSSTEATSIAERWNSWGAQQWTIRLSNSDGSVLQFFNPQRMWEKNYLSLADIEPYQEHRSHFILTLGHPKSIDGCTDVFAITRQGEEQPTGHFAFPVHLVGTFTAIELPKLDEFEQVMKGKKYWIGTITTPEITITITK